MKPMSTDHFSAPLERLLKRDPSLSKEVRGKIEARLDDEVARGARSLSVAPEATLVEDDGVLSPIGMMVAETIVMSHGRPVLAVADNQIGHEFLGPDSEIWAERIGAASARLNLAIPAVGRIEVNNHPDFAWLGTGWLVDTEVVVTNRHVAAEFARRTADAYVFRSGLNGGPMSARIDFLEEFPRTAALEYTLQDVLWIAPPDGPDVAFLRVKRLPIDRPLAAPIALARKVDVEAFVATIGYPARDPRVPDQDLVKRLFGDVYDKKRLSPGQIDEVSEDELAHDCSTLGGCSGAPVIDLASGEAVGLHFSGVFGAANYAVPAPRVAELLRRVRAGELPGASTVRPMAAGRGEVTSPSAAGSSAMAASAGSVVSPGGATTVRYTLNVPIEITVTVGTPTAGGAIGSIVTTGGAAMAGGTGASIESAVDVVRRALSGDPDVVEVRAGWRFKRGWITNERAVVVEVREKLDATELGRRGKQAVPTQVLGFGVDVRTAPLAAQLEHLGFEPRLLEARARPGAYREPPHLKLKRVKAPMRALFHVSPDSGFPNLAAFIGRVEKHLTATMYEWEVNHVGEAIKTALADPSTRLRMVTQRAGTAEAVEDVKAALGDRFDHAWASVGAGGLFPMAYHIKVASRDGAEFWLSSGNWKRSGQADHHPAADGTTSLAPLREFNREWHVIIEHAELAKTFQRFIEFDLTEARRVPELPAQAVAWPDMFVPDAAFEEAPVLEARASYVDPLPIDRELDVEPLLTPDRDSRGQRRFIATATELVHSARDRVYVQNQSFSFLEENVDEFEQFFVALRERMDAGLDVRIVFRDAREFGRDGLPRQQQMLERLKDFGLDTSRIRVQRRLHTKAILVDGERVLFGSHNLTNMGALYNRDASLLVRDAEVTGWFEHVFLFDWEVLARQEADERVGGLRVARADEATPVGFRRVSLGEVMAWA
jgi:hypothetical protein